MRSEDEIKTKINKFKNQFLNSTVAYQRTMIAQKIDALKWVIKDNSDDSWMFNLQEETNE